jgi:hypothetical protein
MNSSREELDRGGKFCHEMWYNEVIRTQIRRKQNLFNLQKYLFPELQRDILHQMTYPHLKI